MGSVVHAEAKWMVLFAAAAVELLAGSALLFDKQNRGSAGRGAWSNKAFCQVLIKPLSYLFEF